MSGDPPSASPAQFPPPSGSAAPTNAQKVLAFQRAIGDPVPERPTPPSPELLALRETLLREEWEEVASEFAQLRPRLESGAATPADLAPLAHELTDLLYVAYGALLALGVDPDAAFAEVHRANVTKAGGPRRPDGKVLKPPGWQAADLRRVIESAT